MKDNHWFWLNEDPLNDYALSRIPKSVQSYPIASMVLSISDDIEKEWTVEVIGNKIPTLCKDLVRFYPQDLNINTCCKVRKYNDSSSRWYTDKNQTATCILPKFVCGNMGQTKYFVTPAVYSADNAWNIKIGAICKGGLLALVYFLVYSGNKNHISTLYGLRPVKNKCENNIIVSIYWFVMILFILASTWNLIALSNGQEIILNSVAVIFIADLDEDLVSRLFSKQLQSDIISYYMIVLGENEEKKSERCCKIPCCCLKVKAIGFRFRQEQTASISRNLFITCLLIIGPVSSMIFMYYQNARHCGAHFAYTQNIEQCFWPADLGGKQDPFNINLWGR